MAEDDPITQEEMIRLFGTKMPIEAATLVMEAPEDKPIGEIRKELRKMAHERRANMVGDIARALVELRRAFQKHDIPEPSLLLWKNQHDAHRAEGAIFDGYRANDNAYMHFDPVGRYQPGPTMEIVGFALLTRYIMPEIEQ